MTSYYSDDQVTLHLGDALTVLRGMPAASVDSVVTSPPYYGLRDYGHDDQWGAEATVGEYVERLRTLFAELRRVLVPTGAAWLNLGDSYSSRPGAGPNKAAGGRNVAPNRGMRSGVPEKSLIGVPWRVALTLQDDGWAVRNELVWAKPNPMPHPVADRLNTAHETVFLLSPQPRYYFDLAPVREPLRRPDARGHRFASAKVGAETAMGKAHNAQWGENDYEPNPAGRNPGDVWTIATQPCPEAHFAVMPAELARRLVLTVTPPGGIVLDPFNGRGTTGRVARLHGRRYVGIDLNADYLDLTVAGLAQGVLA